MRESKSNITVYGDKEYWLDYKLHHTTKPAIVFADGSKRWFQHGKLHRLEGPAVEDADGYQKWFIQDKPYKEKDFKKVAQAILNAAPNQYIKIILNDRTERYLNGRLHSQDDLPAIEYLDGSKSWYQHGLLHRLNGPAIEFSNRTFAWWLNGIGYQEDEFKQVVNAIRSNNTNNKIIKIQLKDRTEYYLNGVLHRDNDLPAIEYADGSKAWYQDGKMHRDNFQPAFKNPNGTCEWWLKGGQFSESEYHELLEMEELDSSVVRMR